VKKMTGIMDLFPEFVRQQKIVNLSRRHPRTRGTDPLAGMLFSEDDFSKGYEMTRPLQKEQF
jgi:hypothetical protein